MSGIDSKIKKYRKLFRPVANRVDRQDAQRFMFNLAHTALTAYKMHTEGARQDRLDAQNEEQRGIRNAQVDRELNLRASAQNERTNIAQENSNLYRENTNLAKKRAQDAEEEKRAEEQKQRDVVRALSQNPLMNETVSGAVGEFDPNDEESALRAYRTWFSMIGGPYRQAILEAQGMYPNDPVKQREVLDQLRQHILQNPDGISGPSTRSRSGSSADPIDKQNEMTGKFLRDQSAKRAGIDSRILSLQGALQRSFGDLLAGGTDPEGKGLNDHFQDPFSIPGEPQVKTVLDALNLQDSLLNQRRILQEQTSPESISQLFSANPYEQKRHEADRQTFLRGIQEMLNQGDETSAANTVQQAVESGVFREDEIGQPIAQMLQEYRSTQARQAAQEHARQVRQEIENGSVSLESAAWLTTSDAPTPLKKTLLTKILGSEEEVQKHGEEVLKELQGFSADPVGWMSRLTQRLADEKAPPDTNPYRMYPPSMFGGDSDRYRKPSVLLRVFRGLRKLGIEKAVINKIITDSQATEPPVPVQSPGG